MFDIVKIISEKKSTNFTVWKMTKDGWDRMRVKPQAGFKRVMAIIRTGTGAIKTRHIDVKI